MQKETDHETDDIIDSLASRDRVTNGLVIGTGVTAAFAISTILAYQFGFRSGKESSPPPDESRRVAELNARIAGVTGQRNLTAAKLEVTQAWSPMVLEDLKQASVRLTFGYKSGKSMASGFVAGPNIIVTSRHALADRTEHGTYEINRSLLEVEGFSKSGTTGEPVTIWDSANERAPIAIIDDSRDLGIIVFPGPVFIGREYLKPDDRENREGKTIATCKNSPEQFGELEAGYCDHLSLDGKMTVFMDSVIGGNSGSPVIDINGRVLGILEATDYSSWRQSDAPPVCVATPMTGEILETLISKARSKYPEFFNLFRKGDNEGRREKLGPETHIEKRLKHRHQSRANLRTPHRPQSSFKPARNRIIQ